MKRLFIAIAFVVLMMLPLTFPLVAHADVVMGNEFFDKNSEKTEPLNRIFQVNGIDGALSSKEKPGSKEEVSIYENGDLILIGHTYLHKGDYWGIPPISHMYWMPGWLPMDELLMVYNNIDFENENRDALYEYTGSFNALLKAEEFYIWQWPGSDREKYLYDYMDLDDSAVRVKHAYLDEDGREWLFISLWGGPTYGGLGRTGATEGWVCLSDLAARIPPFKPAPEPILWVHGEDPDWYGTSGRPSSGAAGQPSGATGQSPSGAAEMPGSGSVPDMKLIIILVAACIAGAIFIIIIVKLNIKKKEHRTKNV